MVNIIEENRKPSFSSALGQQLGQGLSQGLVSGLQSRRDVQKEFARAMATGKMAKQQEKQQAIEMGLGTIGQMRDILKQGRLGIGSGLSGLFSENVRKDRAQYEQLGRSLIPLVAAGVPIRNQREFDEYRKILTDPGASDASIEGALNGLEGLLQRSVAHGSEGEFSERLRREDKKKTEILPESLELGEEQEAQEGPSRTRSLLSALPKGVAKSIQGIADLVNLPVDLLVEKIAPSVSQKNKQFRRTQSEQLEKLLPTQDRTLENILQFTGENVPLSAIGPGGAVAKGISSLAGGLAKTGAKEIGLPEWAQEVASGAGMIAPGLSKAALSKTLKPSAAQKEAVEFLRNKGLTERQITPLIQSEAKLNALSKIASKYPEKNKVIKSMKEGLGGIYEDIYARGAHKPLTGNGLANFTEELQTTLQKINPRFRDAMKKDIEHLFSEPITLKSLAEFDAALNDAVGHLTGGKQSIGLLKGPAENAIKHLDPRLASEYKMVKSLYGKMSNFAEHMTKKQGDSWVKLDKISPAAGAIAALNFGVLPKWGVVAVAAPRLAREFLTNPRLQRMHAKMWEELGKNKLPQALKLAHLIENDLGEVK